MTVSVKTYLHRPATSPSPALLNSLCTPDDSLPKASIRALGILLISALGMLLCPSGSPAQELEENFFRPDPVVPFSIIIGSDPQLYWHLNNEKVSDYEIEQLNGDHVAAMNQLLSGANLPAGYTAPEAVILNGDLTQYGHGHEWDTYFTIYQDGGWIWDPWSMTPPASYPGLQGPIYPGLGNHDYEENVNDCHANGCAKNSLEWMRDFLKGNSKIYDYHLTDETGSLAYSWDIGNVHFIQLQNYPTYNRNINIPWPGSDWKIKKSIDWLRRDLASAYVARKWIVINMHDYGDEMDEYDEAFIDAISGFESNILGIFSGHIHQHAGFRRTIDVNGTEIPHFRCGSSEHSLFNLVQFDNYVMAVTAVDSGGGEAVPVIEPGSTTNSQEGTTVPGEYSLAFAGQCSSLNDLCRDPEWTPGSSQAIVSGLLAGSKREKNDQVGSAFATGDFNGDGRDDLAIGVPKEDLSGKDDSGVVHVIYGSPELGLGLASQRWSQGSPGVPGAPEKDDHFGFALAAGDFDGDGSDDLAIGVPKEDLTSGDNNNDGRVVVLYGSKTAGLTAGGSDSWTEKASGLPGGDPEKDDHFGFALATGDFDGDGRDDLAIGAPFEDVSGSDDSGRIFILYGHTSGLTTASSQSWAQNSSGMIGGSEPNDLFGYSLAAGDFDGDGRHDLAIGVPEEDLTSGDNNNDGRVVVLYGSDDGLSVAGSDSWSESVAGISGSAEKDDHFGFALAAGNFDGDRYDDLAIGAPFEDVSGSNDSGRIVILYGRSFGLSSSSSQSWSQKKAGLTGGAEPGDLFGFSLVAGDFDGSGIDDLAIGVPKEDLASGDNNNDGRVVVLYGSESEGLTVNGHDSWTESVHGVVGGEAEKDDHFGFALGAGDFDGDGRHDLAIGAPFEDVSGDDDAGRVFVLHGRQSGLSSSRSQTWVQGEGSGTLTALSYGGASLSASIVAQELVEGSEIIFIASSPDSTLEFTWDISVDGELVQVATGDKIRFTHDDQGTVSGHVIATEPDWNLEVGSETVSVDLVNSAPVMLDLELTDGAGQPLPGSGGLSDGSLSLYATFEDAGAADTHDVTIDWGDGTVETMMPGDGTIAAGHVYDHPGAWQLILTVTDDDGGVAMESRSIQMSNDPPTVTLSLTDEEGRPVGQGGLGNGPVQVGRPLHLTGSYEDPDALDTHTAVIDWGDGTLESLEIGGGSITSSHVYTEVGVREVILSVIDNFDQAASASREFFVYTTGN